MQLKRTNLNDKITDTINDFNDNWETIENEVSEKVQNFKIKNEVVNGDFSDGTNGWLPSNSTLSANDNTLTVVSTGQLTFHARNLFQFTADNLYYASGQVKVNQSGATSIGLRMYGYTIGIVPLPIANSWNHTSGVRRADGSEKDIRLTTVYPSDMVTTGLVSEFRNIMLIDLTQIFGEGNEPTKEEMDELMKVVPNQWWDGELSPTQKQVVTWQLNLIRKNTNAIIALGGTI